MSRSRWPTGPVVVVAVLAAAGCGESSPEPSSSAVATPARRAAEPPPRPPAPTVRDEGGRDLPASSRAPRTIARGVSADLSRRPRLAVKPAGDPPEDLVVAPVVDGDGKRPADGDLVTVNFTTAYWSDGAEVDASWDRKQVFPFVLGSKTTIPGLNAAVRRMRVGDRRVVAIPPRLAYRTMPELLTRENRGQTLLMVVDLVGVLPGQEVYAIDVRSPEKGAPGEGGDEMRRDRVRGGLSTTTEGGRR